MVCKREIIDACDLCKFPSHDGTCESSDVSLNKDKIITLNTCCDYCMEELKGLGESREHQYREYQCRSMVIVPQPLPNVFKLTFQERIPIFHKLEPTVFWNVCFFRGFSEEQIMKRFQGYKSSHAGAESHIRQELKDSVRNMSPSAQQSWMSMFGNVDESISCFSRMLLCGKFHLFAHQMAYFLSTLDAEDKARFVTEGQILNIGYLQNIQNLWMLIPCMSLDTIERILEKDYPKSILATFCLFTVRNQTHCKLSSVFTQDHVGQLACRFGLPYISSNSSPITFSLNVICPLLLMKVTPFIKFSGRGIALLTNHQVCVSAQLKYKIELQPHSIQVRMFISNVRCHVPCDEKPRAAEFGKEKHFPSKIQIRVEPSEECKMGTQSLTIGKSSNDASRTVSHEEQWEAGIQIPKGPAELKTGKKVGSSSQHSNWRFEMDECSGNFNVGYFDWTLFDNANGVEVWNADSKNYKKLLDPKSSLRNRGSHMRSPFNSNGGCVFGDDLYGNPLT